MLFLEDAAEVEYNLVLALGQTLEGRVCGEEHDYIGAVVGFAVVGELVYGVRGYVWLYYQDLGIGFLCDYGIDDMACRALAQVVDVGLEGHAHHGHNRTTVVFVVEAENGVDGLECTPVGLMVVDGACLCNNLRFLGECCGKEVGSTAMQCPPTPQPGCRMLTRGCLFAKAISSQTFMPARSHIRDSSLAKAICTSRDEFSVSLHISAVRALVGCRVP